MGRRVSRLTLDNLAELSSGCASGRVETASDPAAWVPEVLREWGCCGCLIHLDGEYAGHLLWAPAQFVPGATGFATAPVSTDAVLLVTAHVAVQHRGGGLGRVLIQSMAKDLLHRGGVRAVEAFGDTRGRSAHCVQPADFLLAVGFATHREHDLHPRMRMDLRSTITWRSELESALGRLLPRPGRFRAPAKPITPITPRASRVPREVH
jgi:hypothetical protein